MYIGNSFLATPLIRVHMLVDSNLKKDKLIQMKKY